MADIKKTKDVWGQYGDDPTLSSPNTIKPDASNLIWYNSAYRDSIYGMPRSFSFTDVHATIILPFNPGQGDSSSCYLPGLTLISISEHRDVFPVVSLGRRGIKGFTTGHRTTAGTLGFTLLGEIPFADAMRRYMSWRGMTSQLKFASPDELPPFDLSLVFMNEKGENASLLIRSVKLLDRSQNISVRDIQLTEVYSFMATNCSYFIEDATMSTVELTTKPKYAGDNNPFMNLKTGTTATTVTDTTTNTGATTTTSTISTQSRTLTTTESWTPTTVTTTATTATTTTVTTTLPPVTTPSASTVTPAVP